MNTFEALRPFFDEDPQLLFGLERAISTRGKWKGCLKASPPNRDDAAGWAAWQVLVGLVAPARANMWSLMFMDEVTRGWVDRYEAALKRRVRGWGATLVINAYEPPYRWNLFAQRYDMERIRAMYESGEDLFGND